MSTPDFTIEEFHDGDVLNRHTFSASEPRVLSIGRSETADVPLNDPFVSQLHAKIELTEHGALLRDLGTIAGVRVNGATVRGCSRRLADGDILDVGGIILRVGWQTSGRERPAANSQHVYAGEPRDARSAIGLQQDEQSDATWPAPGQLRQGGARQADERGDRPPWRREPEKYDTREITTRMRRERRRGMSLAALGAAMVIGLLVLPLVLAEPPANLKNADEKGWNDGRPHPAMLIKDAEASSTTTAPTFSQAVSPADPNEAEAAANATSDNTEEHVVLHRVRRGESLRAIALRYFGDKSKWKVIYAANRDKLGKPSRLRPGLLLRIPANPNEPALPER